MPPLRTIFPFLILLLLPLQLAVSGQRNRQTPVPTKIQSYLNQNYSGWRQSAIASNCYVEFKRAVVVGDFNGDGRRDYAVKFIHNRKGYILAFLANGTDYQPHVLLDTSAGELKNIGLTLGRKGDKNADEEGRTSRLPNDAPVIGACESEACPYIYRNGRFNCG
jgi:hypothetical protein